MFRFVIRCTRVYPSLQTVCYSVNKVEVVKGSTQLREHIRSFCQKSNILSWVGVFFFFLQEVLPV